MKAFIVNGSGEYRNLFKELGFSLAENLQDAQLVVFTGGADVHPSFYGAEMHPYTGTHIERDIMERTVFENARDLNIPMVGICRGGQFLNVMSGGQMYQHVEKHTRSHHIVDQVTGETVYVSSTHHQMMKPQGSFILVATSNLGGERQWYDGALFKRDVSKEDIEVVYYPDTNCLCFQPHPEFTGAEYEGMKVYFRTLLGRYLGL